MPFRDSILELATTPFLGPIGTALQCAVGSCVDGTADWCTIGVRASMPGYCPDDALPLIARDMTLFRGETETVEHLTTRLVSAVDSHAIQGNPVELIRQVYVAFTPSTSTPIRLVTNGADWHEINLTTEVVTETYVGTNWNWDDHPERWWRGWVIIDSSSGPWTLDLWDTVATWGDGGMWGSDITASEADALRCIVDAWKPAHIYSEIVVTFSPTLFLVSGASPANPDGDGASQTWKASLPAAFLGSL